MTRSTPTDQIIPALLDRTAHNRCSVGWLRAQMRLLLVDVRRGQASEQTASRIVDILDGKEPA